MKNNQIERLLNRAGLRPSPVRILILRFLDKESAPISVLELEQKLETVDRSSISRAMSLFTEKGLVHAVDDGSGSVRYELCRSSDHHHHDNDMHPHFHCLACGRTFCLEIPLPSPDVPEGFISMSINCVVKGICPDCSKKHNNCNL